MKKLLFLTLASAFLLSSTGCCMFGGGKCGGHGKSCSCGSKAECTCKGRKGCDTCPTCSKEKKKDDSATCSGS
jgi:hypothetical protein